MKRPNIIFFMTDEHRQDCLSFLNDKIKTPNLDALINDGIFFENAYCSNPSCIPSRAAIATGKFPTQCGVPTYITYLPEDETTFMTRLQELGYYTAVIGKQHFAESKIKKGFDEEYIIDGHSTDYEDGEIPFWIDYLKEKNVYNKSKDDGSLMVGGKWMGDIEDHVDNFIGDFACDWLKNIDTKTDKPLFLIISFPGPHQPFDCEGTKYSELYELENMDRSQTTYSDLDSKPPHFKQMQDHAYIKNYSDEIFRKTKRSYYSNVTLIDEKIGEIVKLLKSKQLYNDSLIFFTADHGDFMGDFDMVTKAQYLTEGLMRVPLIVKPPVKDFEPLVVKDNVLNIDIASTCITVAEGKVDKEMSNYNYCGYWDKSKELKIRDYVYMEAGGMKGVIQDGYKLIHYLDRDYGELYDLTNDKHEKYNLWDLPEYNEIKLKLTRILLNQIIKFTPKWDVKWNINDPEI